MIKFEKDNEVIEFENARAAAEWLTEMHDLNDEKYGLLLEDVEEPFDWWVNNNYTAYDILCEPHYFNYDELYEEWFNGLIWNIENNYLNYFTNDREPE